MGEGETWQVDVLAAAHGGHVAASLEIVYCFQLPQPESIPVLRALAYKFRCQYLLVREEPVVFFVYYLRTNKCPPHQLVKPQ